MIKAQELYFSPRAKALGLHNVPQSESTISNLLDLMSVLASVRASVGFPIVVTSGYRCTELNKVVGGAKNSAHTKGLAVDVVLKNMSEYLAVSKYFRIFASRLGYGYVIINEKPRNGVPSWLHLELHNVISVKREFTIK